MTPLHRALINTHRCSICGALPSARFDYDRHIAKCNACHYYRDPMLPATAPPQTSFAIDLGPAIPEGEQYTRGAEQGMAFVDHLLATLPHTEASEQQIATAIQQWASIEKQLDATAASWRALVQPILDRIATTYKPASKICGEAIKKLKAFLVASQAARRQQAAAALATAAAHSNASPAEAQRELSAAMATVVQTPAGMRSVPRWSAKIVNHALVPSQFWTAPSVLEALQSELDKLARTTKGASAPPPGVEWVRTESLERSGR